MAKALDGVNVVEFCSNMGAAYAAMLLAEQGARVIKVEPPGGDLTRGTPHFHVLNRSKRSVFFDFAATAGSAVAAGLIECADVVITGWTPARTTFGHPFGSGTRAALGDERIPPGSQRRRWREGGILIGREPRRRAEHAQRCG